MQRLIVKFTKEASALTLYIFNVEHHVIILSSLPRVMDDGSPPIIEVGRLLEPVEDEVEVLRNVAILLRIFRLYSNFLLKNMFCTQLFTHPYTVYTLCATYFLMFSLLYY